LSAEEIKQTKMQENVAQKNLVNATQHLISTALTTYCTDFRGL